MTILYLLLTEHFLLKANVSWKHFVDVVVCSFVEKRVVSHFPLFSSHFCRKHGCAVVIRTCHIIFTSSRVDNVKCAQSKEESFLTFFLSVMFNVVHLHFHSIRIRRQSWFPSNVNGHTRDGLSSFSFNAAGN